ncbi:MAG TPA: glycine--tRNA ligase subunit beta [Caulobacteraceae bacterium]|nr:glycine--tRNA ligase subunit beta [Caulobacteraceae bacterium]
MPQLLFELFSEEIPARMQAGAARDFERLAREALTAADLGFESLSAFAGPRRLALVVDGLPARQPHRHEERKGPRVGAPEAAIEGFLRSAGVRREDLVLRDGAHFGMISRGGRSTADIIAEAAVAIIRGFPWPKSMTWGAGDLRWVRPLQRILCVFDRAVVPLSVGGMESADLSEGHRVMGLRRPFRARDFDEYREALAGHFVILDAADRKRRVLNGARAVCVERGLELVEDDGLADELAGLAEWPVAIFGHMDARFLDLPAEVIRTSMRTHQRYFAVRAPAGGLAAHFVCIANIEPADGGALIAAGNARVLAARLEDARFFWDEDRRTSLEARLERLKGVIFHAKLGTLWERALRIETLARWIAPLIGAEAAVAAQAARLAKSDLASAMVGEFPELQGIMGGYYAAAEDLDVGVGTAIRDHYKPLGPSDTVPTDPVAMAVALADKLDTLVGFFEIGEKPTGSRDPFALRRTALGLIRIALATDQPLKLRPLIALAGAGAAAAIVRRVTDSRLNNLTYREALAAFEDPAAEIAGVDLLSATFQGAFEGGPEESLAFWRRAEDTAWIEEVLAFVLDRLKALLRDRGHPVEVCEAILGLGDDDVARIARRVETLDGFLRTGEGSDLLAADKRSRQILDAEVKKGSLPVGPPTHGAGAPPAEAALLLALEAVRPRIDAALRADDFHGANVAMAALRAPIDAFFETVMVNSGDPLERDNRLRLLLGVRDEMRRVADFTRIPG